MLLLTLICFTYLYSVSSARIYAYNPEGAFLLVEGFVNVCLLANWKKKKKSIVVHPHCGSFISRISLLNKKDLA